MRSKLCRNLKTYSPPRCKYLKNQPTIKQTLQKTPDMSVDNRTYSLSIELEVIAIPYKSLDNKALLVIYEGK